MFIALVNVVQNVTVLKLTLRLINVILSLQTILVSGCYCGLKNTFAQCDEQLFTHFFFTLKNLLEICQGRLFHSSPYTLIIHTHNTWRSSIYQWAYLTSRCPFTCTGLAIYIPYSTQPHSSYLSAHALIILTCGCVASDGCVSLRADVHVSGRLEHTQPHTWSHTHPHAIITHFERLAHLSLETFGHRSYMCACACTWCLPARPKHCSWD